MVVVCRSPLFLWSQLVLAQEAAVLEEGGNQVQCHAEALFCTSVLSFHFARVLLPLLQYCIPLYSPVFTCIPLYSPCS